MEKPSRGNLFDDDSDEEFKPKAEETPVAEAPAAEVPAAVEAPKEDSEEEYKPTAVEEPKVEEPKVEEVAVVEPEATPAAEKKKRRNMFQKLKSQLQSFKKKNQLQSKFL